MSYVGHPVDVIKKLFSEKKWEEMAKFCRTMLDEDPKDLMALQNLASAYLRLCKFEDALACCNLVLEMNQYDDYALKNKIFALERLKRHEEILSCCDKILEKNRTDGWALDSKGLALNDLGRHEEALSYYEESLEHNPNDTTALVNKAVTLSFLNRHREAIPCYDLAQRVDGSIRGVAVAKSEAYQKMGLEDEAFLAAQGMLNDDIVKFKDEARRKNMKVFDLFCLNEFNDLESKERKHQEKMSSRL